MDTDVLRTTAPAGTLTMPAGDGWWRTAVIYQVYVRSFADGNGDGIGDLAGVRSRLPYLKSLGVDALWFTPWYLSPSPTAGTTCRTTAASIPVSAPWRKRSS